MLARLRHRLARHPETGAFLGFAALFAFFAVAAPETFLTHSAFASILTSQSAPGIAAIGVALLMIAGEFDLSVGSIMGVASLAFLAAAIAGVPVVAAVLIGLAAGAAMGLANGLLLVWTGIPSFIITLGTLLVYRAICLTAISGGRILRWADVSDQDPTVALPAAVLLLGLLAVAGALAWTCWGPARAGRAAWGLGVLAAAALAAVSLWRLAPQLSATVEVDAFAVLNGRLPLEGAANYRTSILWWLALVAVFAVVLGSTRFGNALAATGGSPGAARAQGVDIDRVRVVGFVLSGTLAALAGIVQTARLRSVDPLRGEGLELEVIAAVVIGGTLLRGGYGSVVGAGVGTTLTGMLRTGLVLVGVPANAFRGAIGALVIAAVVINSLVRRGQP